jgi:hypothetical protein
MIIINIFSSILMNRELTKMLPKVGSLEISGLSLYSPKKLFAGA